MSFARGSSSVSASQLLRRCTFEPLERRDLFAVARPDHVVVVVLQDRASDAIGMPIWSYLNQVASTGLVYTDSHGVQFLSEPNTLALYSGSTQGVTGNGRNHSFNAPNLAKSLFDAGLSFSGYVESLPADGSQVTQAGDALVPDLYTRNMNAMAQFTDIGIDPATGLPRPNSAVNRTFGHFSSMPTGDYSSLPTVSYVVPNNMHSGHGSNEVPPWGGSPDEANNDILRKNADDWLRANIDAYLQWAKANNSLLIITQDEERKVGGNSNTVTTVVNGDADLFNPGTNSDVINHYNLLRTITDMYGLAPLGVTGGYVPLDTDATGQLVPDGQANVAVGTSTTVVANAAATVFGQSVTFTATVSAVDGPLVPGGTVTFMAGDVVLGTAALDASGSASISTASLAAGSHAITAVYGGSATHIGGTSNPLAYSVNRAAVLVGLSASANSSTVGQGITFSASVSSVAPGAGSPAGTVQFVIDGVAFGAPVAVVDGVALSPAATMAVGSHTITAVYSGSTNHAGATSDGLTHVVAPLPSTTPANDKFADRIRLTGASVTTTGSNVGASRETLEHRHAGVTGGKSVWWTWTAPASGQVTIDTAGSTFDTTLGVYTGIIFDWLMLPVASNDNAGAGIVTSKVTFNALAGRTYQIAVDGKNGAVGDIALRLQMQLAAPTDVKATDGTFSDKVRVTWDAVAGATSYEIYRSTTNRASTATKIGDATGTSYDDKTAVAGRQYFYFIKAKVGATATSDFSAGNNGHRRTGSSSGSNHDRDGDRKDKKDKDRDDDDDDDDDRDEDDDG